MSLLDRAYDLYDHPPLGLHWVHKKFIVKTLPIDHTLCGGLTYEATLNNLAVDSTTKPLTYESASRAFYYYSEDHDLIGPHTFTVQAHLTNYPVIATPEKAKSGILNVGDPCPEPNLVVATS